LDPGDITQFGNKGLDDTKKEFISQKKLKIMDLTAVSLCQENDLPMVVFKMDKPDNLLKLVTGEQIGTYIS